MGKLNDDELENVSGGDVSFYYHEGKYYVFDQEYNIIKTFSSGPDLYNYIGGQVIFQISYEEWQILKYGSLLPDYERNGSLVPDNGGNGTIAPR